MLLKFFKQTLPQVIIALFIIAIGMWLNSFFTQRFCSFYFDSIKMPFYSFVTNWFVENSAFGRITALFVMLFTAFYLLSINSKHIVVKQRTYLPAFFYILFASSFISLQRINPALFSALFFAFAFDHIFSIYHKENALDNIFKAGFFIALASLFYAPSILYFFTLLLSIISIRTFNIREWFVALFGLATPWFFYFLYYYIFKSDLSVIYSSVYDNLFTAVNQDNESNLVYLLFAYCTILIIVTGFYLLKTLPTQKISVRKYHGVLFWFNLVSVSIIAFIPTISIEFALIAFLPLTFQFSHYFTTTKKRFWPETLFILLIAFAILMQVFID